MNDRRALVVSAAVGLVAALVLIASCKGSSTDVREADAAVPRAFASHHLQAGTRIDVVLDNTISSETASAGDEWRGRVQDEVATQDGGRIPAGSAVDGVVGSVTSARRGSRAMLDLSIRGITMNGRRVSVNANAGAVIAGSTRKRNLGAIAGGALAGALIGKQVGDGKNGAAGALIGGGAATAVVATSKGFQVVLAGGSVMSFTVSQTVAVR